MSPSVGWCGREPGPEHVDPTEGQFEPDRGLSGLERLELESKRMRPERTPRAGTESRQSVPAPRPA